jgi:hypothetical protein
VAVPPSHAGQRRARHRSSVDDAEQRDIFVSFRNDDGSWSALRPLGPAVNTGFSETCPTLSPDGRVLFFSRYDEPGGISDIDWVSSEVVALAPPV